MTDENYERILVKISRTSGLDQAEIERRVEAKRAKLSSLITREGAAQVIAAELGISFDNETLKIDELLPGMRKVNLVGKIINVSPIRTFTTKKGDEGKVANLILADETSNIKTVLWDTNHISLIESGEIKEGKVVEVVNGAMRDNELHLGSFSELKPSSGIIENVKTEKVVKEKKIVDFRVSDAVKTRAFVVQTFEPRFFYVCPECRKKVVSGAEGFICENHGKVASEKRALMNFVIDDGTESARAVVFHEALQGLGINELENVDELIKQRNSLLGKEMVFTGNVRLNKFFNNQEFIVDAVKEVDVDEMIAKMEKS
jgi:replication factor A1